MPRGSLPRDAPSAAPARHVRAFAWTYGLVAAPLLALVGWRVAARLRFEDSLIVLRYARNLVEGNGFVFNLGERVLGVTTPLQTLLAAGLYAVFGAVFGADGAPAALGVLGTVALFAEGALVGALALRWGGPVAAALGAALVLVDAHRSYLYLGMEVHLFTALVLASFVLAGAGRDGAAGVGLGLAFLTRYDAAVAAALVGVERWVTRRRIPWRLVAAFAVVVAPWLVFAGLYFGGVLPHTLGAKEGFVTVGGYLHVALVTIKRWLEAVVALWGASPRLADLVAWWLPLLALWGAWRVVRRERRAAGLVAYPALHLLAYAAIGPDPGFTWHYYVVMPFTYLFLAVGVGDLARRAGGRLAPRRRRLAAALLALVLAAAPLAKVLRDGIRGYRLDPATRELHRIGEALAARHGPETSLLFPAIGVIGWTTRLHIVDHAGLVTPGLYYYDGSRHTPIADAVTRHRPDLVLAPRDAYPELATLGYAVDADFPAGDDFRLWRRAGPA